MPDGLSVGRAIAFSGRPEVTLGEKVFVQSQQQKQAQRAAAVERRRAERVKQENKFRDRLKSIKTEGIDPAYQPEVKIKIAEFIEEADRLRKEDPYGNWSGDPRLEQKIVDLKFYIQDRKIASDRLKQSFSDFFQQPNDYDPENSPDYQRYREDPVGWLDEYEEKTGSRLYTGGLIKLKEPEFDIAEDLRTNVMPLLKEAKDRGQTAFSLPDGSVVTTKTEELTEEDAEAIARNALLNPERLSAVRRTLKSLPEIQQEQYDNELDFYMKTQVQPFIKKETFRTRTKAAAEAAGIDLGEGETKNFRFVTQEIETGMGKVPEIIIVRKDKAELSKIRVPDPDQPTKLIDLDPFSFRKVRDKWYLFGRATVPDPDFPEDKITKQFYVPYNTVKNKIQAKYEGFVITPTEEKEKKEEKEEGLPPTPSKPRPY